MEKFITLTHLKMAVQSLLLKINNEINALSPIAKTGSYTDLVDKQNIMIKGVDYVTAGQKIGTTLGQYATAEGNTTVASGQNSHAEGLSTTASGRDSHAEGYFTAASGQASHAEGYSTKASGYHAHAEGYYTEASGNYSHAEGSSTTVSGQNSHAEGEYTIAQRRAQHVFGIYNIADTGGSDATAKGTYIEIVGNGSAKSGRSNARALDWNGNETLAGRLTLGAAPILNMDAATKQYVDNAIPTITDTYSSTSHDGMSGVAVNSAITTAIGNINSFDIAVVSSTSAVTTPNNHTIYFVPQAVNSSTHDEYMYINNNWELIGTTTIDLSGYLQKTDIAAWAKAANKPSYTASEVGALPDTTVIPAAQVQSDWNATTGMGVILNKPTIPTVPTNVSSFTNDSGYLTLATLPIYDGTVQNG